MLQAAYQAYSTGYGHTALLQVAKYTWLGQNKTAQFCAWGMFLINQNL